MVCYCLILPFIHHKHHSPKIILFYHLLYNSGFLLEQTNNLRNRVVESLNLTMLYHIFLCLKLIYQNQQVLNSFHFLGDSGRPKSESHSSHHPAAGHNHKAGHMGNGNPFQDDRTQIWQHKNNSNLSSPEVKLSFLSF